MPSESIPAWQRLAFGAAGLLVALGAAMLSTIAREEGNLLATALLASSALLMAGMVGQAIIPFLARRAFLERFVASFDYDVTREGVLYLALTLVISVAALNTGNNLLFVVVSAMLAAVAVSGTVSALMLGALTLDVALPQHVFARTSCAARITLHNRRSTVPVFSVSVVGPREEPRRRLRVVRSRSRLPSRAPEGEEWLSWPDLDVRWTREQAEPSIFRGPVYFPYVAPQRSATAELELRFDKRGRYSQDTFGLATRFPFAFLVKTRRVALARELIVYPAVEAPDEMLEVLPLIAGEFESFVRGRGNDLYRIREYLPEDSARHLDWKATARSGSLKVREFTREDERKLRIVFHNPPALEAETYERAVGLAASLAWHFAAEGAQLSFAAPREHFADVHEFLRYLALAAPESGTPVDLLSLAEPGAFHVVLTAEPRGSIPTEMWSSSYVIFL